MITLTRDGLGADPWCAFAIHPQGWCAVWSQPGRVQFEFPTWLTITRAIPTDFLRYLDAVGDGAGHVAAIGVGADDVAYLVRSWTDGAMPLETVSGNFPVGIYWNGVDFVPVLVISDTRYKRGDTEADIPIGGTSQGVRQVLPDGTIRWGDNTHELTIHGRSIHKYSRADDVLAGQRNGPDHIDIYDSGWFTAITGSAQPPRVTRLLDGRYGICAATNHGAVFAIGPPWDALLPDSVMPPPIDPPPPPPPASGCGTIPPPGQAVLRALAQRPDVDRLVRSGDDEDRRKSALMFAQQLAFTLGPEWGSKRADPGRPQTKDSVSRQTNGRLCNWDIVDGASRELRFGDGDDITGQVFIAVTAVDHLGTTPDEPDKPGDDRDDQQDADIVALRRDLAELRGRHDALLARVDALPTDPGDVADVLRKVTAIETILAQVIERLRKPFSTGRAFSHAHPVTIIPPGEAL